MGGTRHAKNATANSFNTRREMEKTGWARKRMRLAACSIKEFDHCTICHKVSKDARVCPKGDIFCMKCIYEFIYVKKQQNVKQLEAWKEQKKVENMLEDEEHKKDQIERFLAFERLEAGVVVQTRMKQSRNPVKLGKEDVGAAITKERQSIYQEVEHHMKRDNTTDSSFWVPDKISDNNKSPIKKPHMQVQCPGCSEPLRLKKLVRAKFTQCNVTDSNSRERWMCPCCKKTLTNSIRCSVLAKCGHVVCITCLSKFVAKEKTCVICSVPCKKKHVVVLKSGGTGFAASGTQMESREGTIGLVLG